MHVKLISWNINGIRAAIKKGLWEKLNLLKSDAVCFQETKADNQVMQSIFGDFTSKRDQALMAENSLVQSKYSEKTNIVWNSCKVKKGYSGVATLWLDSKLEVLEYSDAMNIDEYDSEGRLTQVRFRVRDSNLEFTLINAYYPQGGRGPHRIEYKINFYKEIVKLVQNLKSKGQKVILCGDLNTTVKDIDLARPKENKLTTGCLPEERVALNWFIEDSQFDPKQLEITNPEFVKWASSGVQKLNVIDSFRHFYPDLKDKYTYWDQITRARERNVGWRIDYFIVDQDLKQYLKSAEILDQVIGSDHCPIEINLEF